jgi:hypothetical protein
LRADKDWYLETSKCSDLLSNKGQLVPSGIKPLFLNKQYQSEVLTGIVKDSYITGASGFFNL